MGTILIFLTEGRSLACPRLPKSLELNLGILVVESMRLTTVQFWPEIRRNTRATVCVHSTGNRFQTKIRRTYNVASGITTEVGYGRERAECLPGQNG